MRRGVRIALDWGDARIGVAACDPDGVLAYPVATVRAGTGEIAELVDVIAEYEPIEVCVGLPRSLSGGEGPAATKARVRAERLLLGWLRPIQPRRRRHRHPSRQGWGVCSRRHPGPPR